MKREDLDAWEPQEPAADFAERVIAAAREGERRSGRAANPRPTARRVAVGVLLVGSLAAGVGLAVHLQRATAAGDVVATARREVRVGTRAVAVLERGAHVTWNGEAIAQTAGEVFWRVEPGARFAVHTPGGDVTVKGTCFRVDVRGEDEAMKRSTGVAFGVAAAAAIAVGVYEGRVALSRDRSSVELVAGEQGEADRSGVRKTGELGPGDHPATPEAPAEHALAKLDRARADRLREQLHALFAEAGSLPFAGAPLPYPSGSASAAPYRTMTLSPRPDGGADDVDPSYIQSVVRNDYFPLAKQCYTSALEKNPKLAGTIELSFRILGDPRIGGVVDDVKMGDKTTITDPEVQTCMRESMMSVTFDAPPNPEGVTIVYPIMFSNEDDDAGH